MFHYFKCLDLISQPNVSQIKTALFLLAIVMVKESINTNIKVIRYHSEGYQEEVDVNQSCATQE